MAGSWALSSCVMLQISVFSHCIKMRICYSRTFASEASISPKIECPSISVGLAAFMSSAPGNIWPVWKRRQLLHISMIWQRTMRIGKYSRRRRRFAYTGTLRGSPNPIEWNSRKPMGRAAGNLWEWGTFLRLCFSTESIRSKASADRSRSAAPGARHTCRSRPPPSFSVIRVRDWPGLDSKYLLFPLVFLAWSSQRLLS